MTERELTSEERARVAEFAAVIEADVRVKLKTGPISTAELKQALIEAASTLNPPVQPPIVEVDGNRVDVFVPLEWFK